MSVTILGAQQVISLESLPILQVIIMSLIGAVTYIGLLRLLAPKLFKQLLEIITPLLPKLRHKGA